MKPAAFHYVAPHSLAAAVSALVEARGDGRILAGGQSLVPMLNFRMTRPALLVDINRLPGLAEIEDRGDCIAIGALTRHHALETSEIVARRLPVLAAAMPHVAHLAIRNRGTIGGSLSHADPAAELPMMALLLDATIRVTGAGGARGVAARDFFVGALTTDLADDEIVTEIEFPPMEGGQGWAFEEVARRSGDFALAAAAATMSVAGGRIATARLALTGIGDTPMRAAAAENILVGRALDGPIVDAAVAAVRAAVMPPTDLHASADYRRRLVGALAGRAVATAWRRARRRSS